MARKSITHRTPLKNRPFSKVDLDAQSNAQRGQRLVELSNMRENEKKPESIQAPDVNINTPADIIVKKVDPLRIVDYAEEASLKKHFFDNDSLGG